MNSHLNLTDLLSSYAWFDHPDGPKFVETHRDEYRTSGHWLFLPGAFSAFHKVLNNDELWIIQAGQIRLHLLDSDGSWRELRLGTNLAAGEQPVIAVPAGCWQAAEIPADVPFAFGANVCAPPFLFEQFEIANRAALLRDYPDHHDVIMRLTRAGD